jgi:glycerophosphoryl diester phosphodiesterase
LCGLTVTAVPDIRPLIQNALEELPLAPSSGLVLNIGHRGAAGDAPENTMAAFELALRQGADGIEFDVHLSADGVPVVIHDARLERTTSGSGWVDEHSVAALKRLDAGSWFNERYPAKARGCFVRQRIPLLEEVLWWVGRRGCNALVEIKEGGDVSPEIETKILQAIRSAGTACPVTVISFDRAALQRLHELDATLSLGVSFKRPLLALRRAKLVGARIVVPHWAFASRRFIRRAHKVGLQVVVWTVNQPRWMRRKLADGVDGIITDYPARLAQIRASLRVDT